MRHDQMVVGFKSIKQLEFKSSVHFLSRNIVFVDVQKELRDMFFGFLRFSDFLSNLTGLQNQMRHNLIGIPSGRIVGLAMKLGSDCKLRNVEQSSSRSSWGRPLFIARLIQGSKTNDRIFDITKNPHTRVLLFN